MVVQVIPQTRDEKIAMYMKLTKREIIEMLLNNQEALERFLKQNHPPEPTSIGTVPDGTIRWQT